MKPVKRAVGLALLLPLAALAPSCLRKMEAQDSVVMASEVAQVQSVIRVFRKLVGRDPGASEINALKNKTYAQLVDTILASGQFDQEGYYNLHRERLLLNREGSESWVKNSYGDFCSMRLEMAERAVSDRGEPGYWDLLTYRDRWVRIEDFRLNDCFFGTEIELLLKAFNNPVAPGQQPPADEDARMKTARACVQRLKNGYPAKEGENAQELATKFWDTLKTTPDADQKQSLLYVAAGEELFQKAVKNSLFPQFNELPPTVTQPKDMKIELVKVNGKTPVLQELGTAGKGNCNFTPINPANYVKANGGGGPVFPPPFNPFPLPLPDNPIDFPAPIGQPDTPPIIFEPAVQPAVQPAAAGEGATVGLLLADEAVKADGKLYMKLRFPAEMQGVHASPYWLSRHTSKPKNRHLHRARSIYFSYFCTEINPDAANFQGEPITDFPPELKPYFAADDNHVKGSANCYNCHTKVQPVANFFGILSYGTEYDGGGEFGGFSPRGWPQYIAQNGQGFDRPGGIYDGQKFFDVQGASNKGTEGLAAALTKYPPVKSCVADSTWASLVGRDYPLFQDERAKAVAAFENGGKPSLHKLVKHLLTENKRGEVYFAKGEAEFAKIKQITAFECPTVVPEAMASAAIKSVEGKCKDCHTDEFIDADGKFNYEGAFESGWKDDTPKNRGKLWHDLYCKIKTNKMPPGGGLEQSDRDNIWCHFQRTRDQMAASGKIPAEWKDKPCQAQPPAAAGMGAPHQVGGNPPAGH